jgi:hypothetical protein
MPNAVEASGFDFQFPDYPITQFAILKVPAASVVRCLVCPIVAVSRLVMPNAVEASGFDFQFPDYPITQLTILKSPRLPSDTTDPSLA